MRGQKDQPSFDPRHGSALYDSVQSVNGYTGAVDLDYSDVGALENFVGVSGIAGLIAAAQLRLSKPFIFNGTSSTGTALAGTAGTCFGIAKLITASTRLDYVIFVPGVPRAAIGNVNTSTSVATYSQFTLA